MSAISTPAGPPAGCLASHEEEMMGKKQERLANRLAEIYAKDRHSGAKNIANFAASLKRTVSAIGAITERKFMSGLEVVDVLTIDDRETLQKASEQEATSTEPK
jgi:hypothetical protein